MNAVKRLIVINHIQIKSVCLYNICICAMYISVYDVYINTHMHVYISEKYVVYILHIYL